MDREKRKDLRQKYLGPALQAILNNQELCTSSVILQGKVYTAPSKPIPDLESPTSKTVCMDPRFVEDYSTEEYEKKVQESQRAVQDQFYRMAVKEALHLATIMAEEVDKLDEEDELARVIRNYNPGEQQ